MYPRLLSKQILTQLLLIAMISFISINCLTSDIAFTSEIDSLTGRKELLDRGKSKQTIRKLNYITNKLLGQGVELANEKGKVSCDETALYDNVYEKLTGFLASEVENMIREDEDFAKDRVTVPLKESIYQDFTLVDAFLLRLTSLSFGSIINVNGNIVGSDKFGHFFAQGYTYFKRAYINTNNHGISDALDHGFNSEKFYFGSQTNAIFSYADLSASYEGMNFWKRLLGTATNIDDTRIERKPYVRCKDGKWEINPETSFQWEDYVGPAWDEAVNCSLFRTQEIAEKVQKRITETAKAQGLERDICPADIKKCQEIVDYYKADHRVIKHLISPLCAMAVDYKIIDENDGQDFFSKHQNLYSFEKETRSCYGAACSLGQIGGLALENILARYGINRTIRCKYLNMP